MSTYRSHAETAGPAIYVEEAAITKFQSEAGSLVILYVIG